MVSYSATEIPNNFCSRYSRGSLLKLLRLSLHTFILAAVLVVLQDHLFLVSPRLAVPTPELHLPVLTVWGCAPPEIDYSRARRVNSGAHLLDVIYPTV